MVKIFRDRLTQALNVLFVYVFHIQHSVVNVTNIHAKQLFFFGLCFYFQSHFHLMISTV